MAAPRTQPPSSSAGRRKRARRPGRARRERGFWFDEEAADRAVAFIETCCRHAKGEWAGQLIQLEAWQKDEIIRPAFGWKRPDGSRRYRIVYVEVARKNAKSTLGAAMGNFLLTADGEPGAEVYSAAADRDQAAIIFDLAKFMVEHEPELARRCAVFRRAIVFRETASRYEVLSADVPTKHGKNSHGIIFDEFHAQPDRELYDVLHTSTGARRQPLEFIFTTAGYDRDSICWELHDYALKVRDGIVPDDAFLPVIHAAGPEDDWTDPKVWAKANPNLGVSVKREYLEEECRRAQESPAHENTFRRLHLNQWTEQATRWLKLDVWRASAGRIDPKSLEGQPCFAALDLASTSDLAALALLFPLKDRSFELLTRFWCPAETIKERARKDRLQYDVWAQQGFIEATPGNITDYDVIRHRILEDGSRFRIRELAYDRWNATQLITQLGDDGLAVVPFGQGFSSMSAPTKEFEKLLIGRQLRHGNNPVLNWMAANVSVLHDPADNLKPAKNKSSGKIDGIVAAIMALGRAMVAPPEPESVYKTRPRVQFL